ncbi:hypothetical protein PR202_ga21891 [Eleusine coracana subsp. coracana]|uniref:G domain-containing protein n=1 Tax=Eleusine coracana subsp. coracana TaxID=191504 RepID=A0AAV5D090_ELECO|nr:hypothetical protein PR202_ga21891 [Eleusine coracana subsp. coracana]
MAFNAGGGVVNWFPGHMAAASRAIRDRLKLADLVIEVRDSRIPLSSANEDLQPVLSAKRHIIALNKKDLANQNIMNDCISINAHSKSSVSQLLGLAELKLKEAILKEPTLLIMVVGVPNVGKSALINSIHRIATSRFPVQDKKKRATVGPLPGVTQDIAGYKDLVMEVERSLCSTFLDFTGNIDEESDLESLIDMQLTALRKVFRIPHKPFDETHGPTSKKLLTLFRSGKLGPFILDDLPDEQ